MNKFSLLFSCLFFSNIAGAQNNTSPYSVLGIGDVENSFNNKYTGMGNASVAMAEGRSINNSNAASLALLEDNFFIMELSGRWKGILYKGGGLKEPYNTTADIAIKRANIGFKINKKWGSSVGLQPFSTANYSYHSLKNIDGTDGYMSANYEGSGGVNQFYWANGFRLNKNTAIGVTPSFLFGSLQQSEALVDNTDAAVLTTNSNVYLRNYYINFSLCDQRKLSRAWKMSTGFTWSPRTSLLTETTNKIYNSSEELLKENPLVNTRTGLPQTINAGIAFTKNEEHTITVANRFQGWSDLHSKGTNYRLVNSNMWSVGYQHSRKGKNYFGQTFEQFAFQLGAYGGTTYLEAYGQQLYDAGISIGYGKTLPQSGFGLYGALEIGQRRSMDKGLMNESYINLNFTFSYRGVWFLKKKYY